MDTLQDEPGVTPGLTETPGRSQQAGKIGWILLWLLGVPIPILIALFLIRGCT